VQAYYLITHIYRENGAFPRTVAVDVPPAEFLVQNELKSQAVDGPHILWSESITLEQYERLAPHRKETE